ncbi:hypothetical protein F6Y03_00115 [Bacillus megaterium]|nr:hypothetical protein [Priestia megaterium]
MKKATRPARHPLLRYRTDAIDRELAQLTSKQQQLSMRLSQLSEEIQGYQSRVAAARKQLRKTAMGRKSKEVGVKNRIRVAATTI